MKQRDVRQLLWDIQISISDIEELTEGFTFERYENTKAVRFATERLFITIGEAIYRMKGASEEARQRITDAIRIAGFRHFLVHEYESISDERVWTVVQTSLPVLKQQIDAWANELGMEPPPVQTR